MDIHYLCPWLNAEVYIDKLEDGSAPEGAKLSSNSYHKLHLKMTNAASTHEFHTPKPPWIAR